MAAGRRHAITSLIDFVDCAADREPDIPGAFHKGQSLWVFNEQLEELPRIEAHADARRIARQIFNGGVNPCFAALNKAVAIGHAIRQTQ